MSIHIFNMVEENVGWSGGEFEIEGLLDIPSDFDFISFMNEFQYGQGVYGRWVEKREAMRERSIHSEYISYPTQQQDGIGV